MAAESEIEVFRVERLIHAADGVGVDVDVGSGSFSPSLIAIAGPPPPPLVGPARPPDRVLLVDTERRVALVVRVDAATMMEILAMWGDGGGTGGGVPPASKASIEAIRTVDLEAAAAAEECSVCLDGLGAVAKEMPCGHRFHGCCIGKWLEMHGLCPLCRFQMPAEGEAASRKGENDLDGGDDDDDGDRSLLSAALSQASTA